MNLVQIVPLSPSCRFRRPRAWTLTGTVYTVVVLPTSTTLPAKAFPPLERNFRVQADGEYVGILGIFQIIRYADSPVGPYDKLLIVPDYFQFEGESTTMAQ